MGKRNKVTTRDIAEQTGFSQSTVSMILSGKPSVSFSEETIEKVRAAAADLGYKKPQKKSKPLNRSLSDTIMVLCPTLANGYYYGIIHTICEQARLYGYKVLTAVTFRRQENEDMYFQLFRENVLAGVILLYPLKKYTEADSLTRQVPVVSIGEKAGSAHFDSVELDSRKPGYVMAEHLLSLGHRQITYISGPVSRKESSRLRRLEGFRQCLTEHGLDPLSLQLLSPGEAVYNAYPVTEAEYRTGYDMTIRALDAGSPSTAYVGHCDTIACGILAAMADRGLHVPEDCSVAGFDNTSMAAMPQLSLTTVEHSAGLKGKKAVDLIHQKNTRSGVPGEEDVIVHMEYEPRLIIRKTTAEAFHKGI